MPLSSAGCAVWAGERVGAEASRKLFHNRTPKSTLLEETVRERGRGHPAGTQLRFQLSLRGDGGGKRGWGTPGDPVLRPRMWVRLLTRKFKGA